MTKQNIHLQTILVFLDIGWKVSLPLVFLVLIGSLLDNQFGTKPLFIFAGIALSIFTTTWVFYRLYRQISKEKI
jgi:F0F1-type ATP synthase assembly protein I